MLLGNLIPPSQIYMCMTQLKLVNTSYSVGHSDCLLLPEQVCDSGLSNCSGFQKFFLPGNFTYQNHPGKNVMQISFLVLIVRA